MTILYIVHTIIGDMIKKNLNLRTKNLLNLKDFLRNRFKFKSRMYHRFRRLTNQITRWIIRNSHYSFCFLKRKFHALNFNWAAFREMGLQKKFIDRRVYNGNIELITIFNEVDEAFYKFVNFVTKICVSKRPLHFKLILSLASTELFIWITRGIMFELEIKLIKV